MSGRKSIMVDTPTWEKIDGYKHDLHLRNIGDAIGDAIDIVISDEYYAGIYVDKDEDGKIRNYIVEALGKTEEEAIRNLLLFEQGSLYGDVHAEDIPPYSEFNEKKDRFFVIECVKNLYYEIMRYTDVNCGKSKKDDTSHITLYSCDRTQFNTEEGRNRLFYHEHHCADWWALISSLSEELIAIGASEVELHRYFKNSITNGELKFNSGDFELLECDDKELIDEIYQTCGYYPGTSRLFGCFARIEEEEDQDNETGEFFSWSTVVSIEKSYYVVISLDFKPENLDFFKGVHEAFNEKKLLSDLLNAQRSNENLSLVGCGDSLIAAAKTIPTYQLRDIGWVYDVYNYVRVGLSTWNYYLVMRCTKALYDQFESLKYSNLTFGSAESLHFSDGEDLIADVATSKDETNPDAARDEPKEDAEKIDEEKTDEEKSEEEKND